MRIHKSVWLRRQIDGPLKHRHVAQDINAEPFVRLAQWSLERLGRALKEGQEWKFVAGFSKGWRSKCGEQGANKNANERSNFEEEIATERYDAA
jgi:hypothetical protein